MNKLPLISLLVAIVLALIPACKSDDNDLYNSYKEWLEANENWLNEQKARKNADGTPYYETVVPSWNPGAYVLIHYFNDRSLTADNLSPLSTSTIDTRYIGHYYNDVPFDSSYNQVTPAPGVFRTQLTEVIEGWTIAFETMHVGDTAEIIIPYESAYGVSLTTGIAPYSNLRFNTRLIDIPYYETSSK